MSDRASKVVSPSGAFAHCKRMRLTMRAAADHRSRLDLRFAFSFVVLCDGWIPLRASSASRWLKIQISAIAALLDMRILHPSIQRPQHRSNPLPKAYFRSEMRKLGCGFFLQSLSAQGSDFSFEHSSPPLQNEFRAPAAFAAGTLLLLYLTADCRKDWHYSGRASRSPSST